MRIILPHDLEMLKVLVLHKAEIQVLIPSIIKDLSSSIFSTTRKRLSDTTLKRIFGFADTPHQPSLYTVNVLAEYCGYLSYQEFCEQQIKPQQSGRGATANDTSNYYQKARVVSEHTLMALKHKSGIPFALTIDREFLNDHLRIFELEKSPATVIAAPAGYGKTIALCHWVEKKLNDNCKNGGKDVILFLSGKVMNRTNFQTQLFDWLTEMMGLSDEGLSNKLNNVLEAQKFYFIIDAFDTTSMEQNQWNVLLDLLMDTLSIQQKNTNFKVIVTMRSAAWLDCKRQLQPTGQLDHWYEGFWTDKEGLINIPLLNGYELKDICLRINPVCNEKPLCTEAIDLFGYPLFLQYFYQKHKEHFSLAQLDTYHAFDIIHQYVYEKVYIGQYSTEKMMLIHSIIDHSTLKESRLKVDKLKIYDELVMFKDAFKDLKSNGMLREINNSDEQSFAEQIEFAHEHLQTYFMASKIINNHDRVFDEGLMDSINLIPDPYFRLKVLKWCMFTALKSGQHFMFENLDKVVLRASEKRKLIKFLSSLIAEGHIQHSPALAEETFDQAYPKLFDYFFAVELYGPELESSLKQLAKQPLTTQGQIALTICLAVHNLLALDCEALETNLAKLKALDVGHQKYFAINPIKCLEALYYYLRFNVIKPEALEEITHFCFNPALEDHFVLTQGINNIISILALHTLQITGNLKKQLRFAILLLRFDQAKSTATSAYQDILLINSAQLLLALGNRKESQAIFEQVQAKYEHPRLLTSYLQSRMDFLKAQLAVDEKDFAKLSALAGKYLANKNSTYPIFEANIFALLLLHWKEDKDSAAYKSIYIRFIKLVQTTRFSPQAFLLHSNPINPIHQSHIKELIHRR
ncbi:MAG: NACHT domain-containing protein [Pedobacter sp.]|nr:NACHT domain-containing protein [Pedobacter sp.]